MLTFVLLVLAYLMGALSAVFFELLVERRIYEEIGSRVFGCKEVKNGF